MVRTSATLGGAIGIRTTSSSIGSASSIAQIPSNTPQVGGSADGNTQSVINTDVQTIGGRVRTVGGSQQTDDGFGFFIQLGLFGAIVYGVSKLLNR
jgi:hypothetical protein